jgi:signal transduction histidine kinase/CheY-like chemotaxis protein/HPt (histidine-containing phosphotransfer) domain-containing protein
MNDSSRDRKNKQIDNRGMGDSLMFFKLFEQSSDGIAVVDLKTLKINQINTAFLDIIEAGDEINGKSFRDLIVLFCGEKNLEATVRQMLTCVKEESEFVADAIYKEKKKNTKKYIRLSVKPLDKLTFFVEAKDISEFEKNKLRMNKAINEAKLTSKLVTIASTSMNDQLVLDTVCKELAEAVGLPHIAIVVLENKGNYFEIVAEHAHDGRRSVVGQKIDSSDPALQKIFNTKIPLIVDNITQSITVKDDLRKILQQRGTISLLGMPLNVRGQVIGIICFDSAKKHEFSQDEIYLAKHVAGTTGHILEVERLYIELQAELVQRRTAEMALRTSEDAMLAIYNITSSHTLTYSEKIQAMLSLGCQLFDMEVGVLTQFENGKHNAVEIYSEKFDSGKELIFYSCQGVCDILVDRKEPYAENLDTPGYLLKINDTTSFRLNSFLGIQVKVHGMVYGTLIYFNTFARANALSATDREFLRLMAQWMGTEIEREEFLDRLKRNTDEIEIKNIELAEARDQALEISRLKSEFLATVSHETRTPMNAVIGMTDLLLHTELNKEQREYAKIVNDSAQLLLKLINDILDFSKIEAGKILLEKIPFDIEYAIETSVDMFSSKARDKGIDLIIYISKMVPKLIIGDLLRLQQVLMNLLGNAVKFTESGSVVVSATIQEERENSFLIRFGVQDTGIGIPAEVRDRLFQPFTQADGSTTRKYGGTGLGLAISKRLVELMGGEIGLESEENKGSNFWFTLEFDKPKDIVYISDSMNGLTNVRALVIEKNQTYKDILCQYLKDWGAEAYGVRSFDEMAKLYKAEACFDLLIIDQANMTRLDAFKFGQITKEIENFGETKIVFIASIEQKGTKEFGNFGSPYKIVKPIKRTVYYETVKNAMFENNFASQNENETESVTTTEKKSTQYLRESFDQSRPTEKAGEVLLAEDNKSNQRLATLQLANLGFDCICVSSGYDAVEAVTTEPERFKFVLMDSQMPGMNGLTAAAKIRDFEFTRGLHIPIIAMTGNASDADRAECLKAGMDEYISKPVTMEKMTQVIQRIFPRGIVLNASGVFKRKINTRELFPTEAQETLDENIIAGIKLLQIDGQPDILTELIDLYLRDSKTMLTSIRKAAELRDGIILKRWAHSLKGASANVGARKLASYLSILENQATNSNFSEIPETVSKIETEYLNTYRALERERKTG